LQLKTPITNGSYTWNTGATTQQIIVKQAGIYSVKVISSTCAFFDTIRIATVNRPSISLGNDTALCSNDILQLAPAADAGQFKWQDGSTDKNFIVRSPGLYWLQYTHNSCSITDSIQVSYRDKPAIFLGKDTVLCKDQSLLLEAADPSISKYEWQDGSTLPSYLVSTAGLYRVTVTALNGCTNKDTITITGRQLPEAHVTGDSVLCNGYPILLTGHVTDVTSFSWQNGSTSPQLSVNNPGLYMLNAMNECGTTTVKINIVKGLCSLILPTAFTPNEDRNDDIFRIKYPFATRQFLLTVYNRWGQKIFGSTDMKKGWDGTYRGQIQPAGPYIWFVSLIDEDGHAQNVHGSVLLIR
jgi:large repetitive protein